MNADFTILNGWGMRASLWNGLREKLDSMGFRSRVLDVSEDTLVSEDYLLQLSRQIGETRILIGWSLGGMLATEIASVHSEQLRGLVLICCSGSFVQNNNWPHAMEKEIFTAFYQLYKQDPIKLSHRFSSVMAEGVSDFRELKRFLESHVGLECGVAGLDYLASRDLITSASGISVPVKLISGKHDSLVSDLSVKDLSEILHTERLCYEFSGHAPFISEPERMQVDLINFINQISSE